MNRKLSTFIFVLVVFAGGLIAGAQVNPGLFTFKSGDAIVADEVNHNFAWLDGRIDGVDTAVNERLDSIELTPGEQGIQGDPGPQGEVGPQGEPGTPGPVGLQGPAGPQGLVGPHGVPGIQGDAGPQGDQGERGVAGPQGLQGETGPRGETGAPGATGPAGPTGPAGAVGATGPQGPAGEAGPAGETGPQGPAGATGSQGAAGAAGPRGPQGPTGSQGPTGPMGPQGPAANLSAHFGVTRNISDGMAYDCTIGNVWLSAGYGFGAGTVADGRLLSIPGNTALFSLLGTTYGGNGTSTFALPDLRSVAPKSANGESLTYLICTSGIFPTR